MKHSKIIISLLFIYFRIAHIIHKQPLNLSGVLLWITFGKSQKKRTGCSCKAEWDRGMEKGRQKEAVEERRGNKKTKRQRKSINTLVKELQLFTPCWASRITDCVQDADCGWQLKMNCVRRHRKMHTPVHSHTLSPRHLFSADQPISIATFTAVGDGDIMKIDFHRRAEVKWEESSGDKGVS